jgi:hypothetical protein
MWHLPDCFKIETWNPNFLARPHTLPEKKEIPPPYFSGVSLTAQLFSSPLIAEPRLARASQLSSNPRYPTSHKLFNASSTP